MLPASMRARTSLASSRASRTAFARPPSSSLRTTSTTPRLNARSPLASTSRLTLDVPASSRALSTSARLDLASPLRPSPPLSFPRAPRLSLREQQNGENDEFDGDEGREGGEGEGEEKVPVRRPGVPQTEQPRSGLRNPSSAGTSAGTRGSGGAAEGGAAGGRSGDGEGNSSVAKSSVPNVYPQVMALPITRRPLFPGFYKAVVVRDPEVIKAIKESISRGQPYLGAFLLKDENADSDVITDPNSVHPVGVFCQITSTFPTNPTRPPNPNSDEKPEEPGLTVVLFPHRRIRIDELLPVGTPNKSRKSTETEMHHPEPHSVVDEHRPHIDGPQRPEEPAFVGDAPLTPESASESKQEPELEQSPAPIDRDASTEAKRPDEPEFVEGKERADVVVDDEGRVVREGEGQGQGEGEAKEAAESSDHQSFQTAYLHNYGVSIANVSNLEMEPYDAKSQVVRAISGEIVSVFKEIASLNPLFRDQIANFSMSLTAGNIFEEPEKLADFAAAVSAGEVNELQDVLESMVLEDRLQKGLLVIKKELMNAQLQNKISKDVESKIAKRQREYILQEQLKGIKKELGLESDGKDKLVEKFKEKAKSLLMPEAVQKVFDEELNKLGTLEPAASEFNVTRNYLDWLTSIPWGHHTKENFDLTHAVKVLDEDHYGLKDVKDRILEFLAVGKLRGTVEGKILCFVGPPGVGKTSIGKSIARALDRQFFRFSVGGLSDVAEIKGHRRTYVGAMPGKIIQALKKVQTENPLVLIDEVDKIGRGHNGDPSSALLEMLDPEQNAQFLDHYLDVPVDLSRVLFVCTANTLDTIPAPLLDRMEVLEVSGYITEEKAAIASKYLAPAAKEGAGLKNADVELQDDAVAALIRYYCRESGVRRLKQQIEKVFRKAALKIVQDIGEPALPESAAKTIQPEAAVTKEAESKKEETTSTDSTPSAPADKAVEKQDGDSTPASTASPSSAATPDSSVTAEERKTTTSVRQPLEVPSDVHVRISAENLLDYVGPPLYQKDRLYTKISPVGVSTGLGYLGNGSGAVMPIEVTSMPGQGIQLTGKLGEVIKESAQIALAFLRAHAYDLGLTSDPDKDLLEKRAIHLHMPEGAIGKEGPSAGIAILTAFVSLFSKRGVSSELAMTGEVTLAGQVLPVGGLKEKTLAAHRAGIRKLILPLGCKADIEHNVPESVKEGIEIVYAENVAEVLREAFAGSPIADKINSGALNDILIPREEAKR
ncbi:Lon protease [Rhodotorula toruloides ATCC 204091]|uniref:Lon protease homolog, mitochondrial n=1 Tax=Rhodotorula toruloides TaxID=5286 RepID=A0A0K3C6Q9_RHOTO|nr:Lon protease [Rhodotorula toruloides ATCC 204091]KAK4331652.1 Lon protease-like protein [Rhodotorula toruloides]PRQ77510.1 Lon protease [Rhodotorula toruloides]